MRFLSVVLVTVPIWGLTALAGQDPILLTFDLHVDPIGNGLPEAGKVDNFENRNEWTAWVLDQTEPLSIPIAFLSGGWYMERLVDEGAGGDAAAVVRRLYASGGQIGSHHHDESRAGVFNWPKMRPGEGDPGTRDDYLDVIRKQWRDNIQWVNRGIETAFSGSPPKPVEEINRIKGAHMPNVEADYHQLMGEFGLDVREPGPEEDYYGYFGHHIWRPFRPSPDNYMAEDLTAGFVAIPSGPVIGSNGIHHGVLQDMRPASMKRQLLQLYLNWRHAHRSDADAKVWTWGWGSHVHDFDPAKSARDAFTEMLPWIETHFRGRIESDGSDVLEYATHLDVADAYYDWEATNPGASSFSFDSLEANDWDTYPWLQPVAEAMRDWLWSEDLAVDGMDAFAFERQVAGETPGELINESAVLVWKDEPDTEFVDLSTHFEQPVRVLKLESGEIYGGPFGVPPTMVPVADEPIWVTTVPEPGTAVVLGSGLFGLIIARRLRWNGA